MNKKVVLTFWFLATFQLLTLAQEKQIRINIQFDGVIPADLVVVPAILKYDKEFAYSFTFDDAYSDAYGLGYKLLNGGSPASDGNTYPGLYSTDGCGNPFPFRAAVAWYTANQVDKDLHKGTPGYLTYPEAIELYQSGWDFLNHSYNHDSYPDAVDYTWQLDTNRQVFKVNTGLDFHYCVPPSGDTLYIDPAFALGLFACYTSSYGYSGADSDVDVTLPVPYNPVYWRQLISSDRDSAESLIQEFNEWAATTGQGKQKWWNQFTHRVDYNLIGSSMQFPAFREYFEYLEKTYGSSGKDNGWFASSSEVFEYLLVRDKIMVSWQINGSEVEVLLDYSGIPETLRYYDLSLMIRSSGRIASVTYGGPGKINHTETANGHLINLDLPDSRFSAIETHPVETAVRLKGFPNPVSGRYYLSIPDNFGSIEVRISGILSGNMAVPAYSYNNGLIMMDFTQASYPPGMYVIRVFSKGRFIGYSKVFIDF